MATSRPTSSFRLLILACAATLLPATSVSAFPSMVGLHVDGSAGEGHNSGGVSQVAYNAPSYYIDRPGLSTSPLTGETGGTWSHFYTPETKAESQAIASFGSLGVSSYSWASVGDPAELEPNYRIFSYGSHSQASANFYDGWQIDVPDLAPGTRCALSVTVELDGSRTTGYRNHFCNTGLSFYNYQTGSGESLQDVYPGIYVLNASIELGRLNGITMGLVAETSAGYEGYNDVRGVITQGGIQYVDFLNTAKITGLALSCEGNEITNYTLTALSGQAYPVPEPASLTLVAGAMTLLSLRPKRRQRVGAAAL